MAEIVKPQYQSNRNQIYNVAPIQEQYRGLDENAGQVDMSNAKLFDELQKGLGVFAEIYKKSEDTANILQAKKLLRDKLKDTQRITELLKTELPNTRYEHLKLKDVLNKYKTMDGSGRTDLNIGSELQHNISALQMPDDINDDVKAMIDDDWLTMDIGIVNDIMGQVDSVQSAQTLGILDYNIDDYKGQVLDAYMTDPTGNKAKDLRIKMNEQVDELGFLGTWNLGQIRDKKLEVGQIMLNAQFQSEWISRDDPDASREEALLKARKGLYKYKDENGIEITLNSNYWEHLLINDNRNRQEKIINENLSKEIKNEEVLFQQDVRRLWKDSRKDIKSLQGKSFGDAVGELVLSNKYKHVRPAALFQAIFQQEKANLLEQDRDAETELKETQLAHLEAEMARIGMMFDDPQTAEAAKHLYGEKDKDGYWVGKSSKWLQKKLKNPYVMQHHISNFIRVTNQRDRQEFKVEEEELIKFAESEARSVLISKAKSDLMGASTIMHMFGKQIDSNGKKIWTLDYAKLGSVDTVGGKYLILRGIGNDGGRKQDRTHRQLQTVQAATILPIFDLARGQLKEFIKQEKEAGEEWSASEIYNWSDRITSAYATNIHARAKFGKGIPEEETGSVRRRTTDEGIGPYPKGKAPSEKWLTYFAGQRDVLERVAIIAENHKTYSLQDLRSHMSQLNEAKDVLPQYKDSHDKVVQQIMPVLMKRQTDLTVNVVETGLLESDQAKFIKETGSYNMEKYWEWQKKHGVFKSSWANVVPKELLAENSNIGDINHPKKVLEHLAKVIATLNLYGDDVAPGVTHGMAKNVAYHEIKASFPYKWQDHMDDAIWDGENMTVDDVLDTWDPEKLPKVKSPAGS
tara:strand:- start:679 stop:3252 length:2574 start_codon:yes stop_codon:yes gene_type:complete